MLAATLALLSSRELAQVARVSRHFYAVGVRVLYRRLVDAARLPDHELILECYHPSAKISTPYLACRYLGTRVADGDAIDDGAPALADLDRLYSSFRPVVAAEEDGWPLDAAARQRKSLRRRRRRRRRAGHGPEREAEGEQEGEDDDDDGDEMATQDIDLDQGELFSQLCTVTNVVKHSSMRGLFVSHVNTCDGVLRVWRKWLADAAAGARDGNDDDGGSTAIDRDRFLWVDAAKSVGLRFRVAPAGASPHADGDDDEPAVSYTLVYQGMSTRAWDVASTSRPR